MPDHVHMCLAIPPKHPGRLGDRLSEREERHCHRTDVLEEQELSGEHFWARGYALSTVSFELEQVHKYIRD